jgi:ketosteroid isomerase-like protein
VLPAIGQAVPVLLSLAGLALGFALPVAAQEQRTIDPKIRQEVEAVETAFQDAYNKHDAAAIAALHTQDAVELRAWQGSFSGQEAIQKMFEADFAKLPGNMDNKIVQMNRVSGEICAIIDTNVGGNIGHAVRVYTFGAPTWKIRMTYVTF